MKLTILATALAFATIGCETSSGVRKDVEPAKTSNECKHDDRTFRCVKYLRNYDADTVTFNIPGVHPLIGTEIAIRVNGIDTPELRTKNECEKAAGYKARDIVRGILEKGKRIDLVNVDRGKYFRIVADVIVDGHDMKQSLLKDGYAYEYDGGTKQVVDWCKVAPTKEAPNKK